MNPSELLSHRSVALAPVERPALKLLLRDAETGAAVGHEPVRAEDLADHIAEAWRDGCLRQGHPEFSLAQLSFHVRPILKKGQGPVCEGFRLEAQPDATAAISRTFTIHSLRAVANRGADRYIALGRLKRGQTYTYELHIHSEPESPQPTASTASIPSTVSTPPMDPTLEIETADRSPGLTWHETPLRPLIEKSTAFPSGDEDAFHVFLTASALARAELYARKGAAATPAVETGAVLLGVLASCPDSGDFFVVVTDAYEVLGAEQKVFSLNYTDRSWTRIQSVLKARQSTNPALRLVGQAHGHNFLPGNGKTCAACPTLPVCDLNNLYASEDDQLWTRATFAGAPYALCFIFGLSARGDRLHGLFTQHDARLRQRGYFVLPEFEPEAWPCRSAARA